MKANICDIGLHKAEETNLAQLDASCRELLETAPDAMVIVNQSGEIVLSNMQAQEQFGYLREELVGQHVQDVFPKGLAERLIANGSQSGAEAFAHQSGSGVELIARRKDGSEFPIELTSSTLQSAAGILVTAAIRDISVRKAAEARLLENVAELNRSNKELGQFAHVAAHDLQEPLRMVASYTALLSKRYKGKLDADADEFIRFAADGASRMQQLVRDLLTRSRVGAKSTNLLDTSSEAALQQALVNLRGAIKESGAQVTHDPLPTIRADEMQLVQLFQNLVGNAIKYQNPGVPRIHVSVSKNIDNSWVFSVQDNGLGIESQYFDQIFEMFHRLHNREEFAGTGIGLAICKKIVERHGGSITVESQPGHGSTFRFTLSGNPSADSSGALPPLSLPFLLSPLLKQQVWPGDSMALVTVEILPPEGLRAGRADDLSRDMRSLLQRCLLPDLDVLLPTDGTSGLGELFHVVAFADERGVAVLIKRIQEQFRRLSRGKEFRLVFSTSYSLVETPLASAGVQSQDSAAVLAGTIENLLKSESVARVARA